MLDSKLLFKGFEIEIKLITHNQKQTTLGVDYHY
jgi:hypothetical protein